MRLIFFVAMLHKSDLAAILKANNIWPNKTLGQNFLVDENMKEKIINHCHFAASDTVVEIGPGLGVLTVDIARRAKNVIAIEKDKRLCALLEQQTESCKNIHIMHADILTVDIRKMFKNKKITVVGNLPYSITSPIITHLINNKSVINTVLVTVQREVGKRFTAHPGSKDYGSLSVYVQFFTKPRQLFVIKKGVFHPVPAVDSAFMRLDILETPSMPVKSERLFFTVTRKAFTQRRKTILNALAGTGAFQKSKLEALFNRISLDPMKRPDQLSLHDFAAIANALSNK